MSTLKRDAAHMPRGRRSRHVGRIAALCVLGLILTGTSVLGFTYLRLQGNINQTDVDSDLGTDRPRDKAAGNAMNILVMGSDVRKGDSDIDGAGAKGDVVGMRADTTMLVHISADRKRMVIVSIPRDTLVEIPSCVVRDGDNPDDKYESKPVEGAMFNSAFATGGQKGNTASAAACAMKTVEKLTDIRLEHFAVVSFSSFQHVVNSLDGVPMYFDQPLEDSASGLNVPAGCQILHGDQALALARARKNVGDGSDIGRISRQQDLVNAIVSEVKDLDILTDFKKLYKVLDVATQGVETSKGLGDVPTLAGLANSLSDVKDVKFITMPWEPAGPRVQMRDEASKLWDALKNDKPVPFTVNERGELVDPSATAPAPPTDGSADGAQDAGAPQAARAPSAQSAEVPSGSKTQQDKASKTVEQTPQTTKSSTPACTKANAEG